ncbi:MAG: class I SAM-dependent DNA methyltransferase [Chloroflexi bacterium]|nr:class I SAM-dependent DNA methyltransferase [Chloroflexota bacterium]MYD49572.1 class I SAM-dependent DNA methyltransferase [Chloroflexota bacterium]
MAPQDFIARWRNAGFGERQGAQSFFNDLCGLVGHPTPASFGSPEAFTFEKAVPGGFADAYFEYHFGWEFKGQDAQLDGAFDQLLRYQVHLKTPPLLIVSSFQTIRIQTNFPGMETARYDVGIGELTQPERLDLIRDVFFTPHRFRERLRSVDAVTRETAALFQSIVEDMEERNEEPERLARYLNQLVFCLYSEDAGLLPEGLFTRIVAQHYRDPATFDRAARSLFGQMATGGFSGADEIAHFNGDLFNVIDTVELSTVALQRLGEACEKNWRDIEPSIFGTLFERALDASKRAQTGAHYTGAADIELVVEPVVMTQLRREWETARAEIEGLDDAPARAGVEAFRRRLASVSVLDPACGSGNFLYIALRSLLDLEREVIDFAAAQGWHGLTPTVQPDQMLGLEINHYAAELARTALWIGYIQWHQANGFPYTQRPILTPLDTIRQTDAILDLSDPEHPAEPEWPAAEFIVGNPPFLGHFPFRESLGDEYVDAVYGLYGSRIPNSSDLCCYWFEKARAQIEAGVTKRAGLLATQAIRFQSNRPVLTRIKETGDIFAAIPDQDWVLAGATVHTSIVCFDDGSETERYLDSRTVANINVDLTSGHDLTLAERLVDNRNTAFQGIGKVGDFDIPEAIAKEMLVQANPHGRPNSEVIKRWVNGTDIAQRSRNIWIIDFGVDMAMDDAALYEAPFEYVKERVMPTRIKNKMKWRAENWWLHGYPATTMRQALAPLPRYIATPKVAKHRFFVWLEADVLPSNLIIAIASSDDYMLGVLSSSIHELWARQVGSQLREADSGGTYTPTTCFETFPFPRPTEGQRDAIGAAAAELNRLREGWLNPEGIGAAELRRRTLTNLYNQRPTWLDNAHGRLDAAVADAYGWPADLEDGEVLERLLALNLERAGE